MVRGKRVVSPDTEMHEQNWSSREHRSRWKPTSAGLNLKPWHSPVFLGLEELLGGMCPNFKPVSKNAGNRQHPRTPAATALAGRWRASAVGKRQGEQSPITASHLLLQVVCYLYLNKELEPNLPCVVKYSIIGKCLDENRKNNS